MAYDVEHEAGAYLLEHAGRRSQAFWFLLIAVLSVRAVYRRIRYETWYYLHLYTYLALGLAFAIDMFLDQERNVLLSRGVTANLFMRRELFEELGGFDERYFVYYEEVDLCLRARRSGWASYHLDDAEVVHAQGVSSRQIGGLSLADELLHQHGLAASSLADHKQDLPRPTAGGRESVG